MKRLLVVTARRLLVSESGQIPPPRGDRSPMNADRTALPRSRRRGRARLVMAFTAILCAVLVAAPAALAAPRSVEPLDLSAVHAKAEVVDRILPPGMSARAAGARTQQFTDDHGHLFSISTDVPGVDLQPYASVFAGLLHGDEVEQLRIEAVTLSEMGVTCGTAEAVACYRPDDPDRSFAGQIWFALDDPDVVHTIVHEYGHHTDNQLLNLRHLGLLGCSLASDGSRNWFFEREIADDILGAGIGCDPAGDWEHLLGEVYAEDFVVLNGIHDWQLSSVRAPTSGSLTALLNDIANPFEPYRFERSRRVPRRHARLVRFDLDDWSFVTIRMRGPRRTDLDLYLYPAGSTKRLERSTRRGSTERIARRLLAPGGYRVGIYAYKGSGRARVRVDVE